MQLLQRSTFKLGIFSKQFMRTKTVNNNEGPKKLKDWREIPGPSSLPVIGPLLHFLPGGSLYGVDILGVPEMLYDKYGPIIRFESSLGSPTLIFLFDADASSQILRNENTTPIRTGFGTLDYFRKKCLSDHDPNKSTGLITEHGELWQKFRSTVNPIMHHSKTIQLYQDNLNEVAEDMINRMKTIRNDKNMLKGKFNEEMNLWALESISVVALGGRLHCLDRDHPKDSPVKKFIYAAQEIFTIVDELDFKPNFWKYFSTPTFKKAMKLYEDQVELSKYFIGKAIIEFKTNEKSSQDEKGVLEKLLDIDENVAVTMASDMLFAGVDTVANAMTAILFLLAKNPNKQNKLREEIMSENIKRPYLKACIKESMRMLPVVGANLRQTTKEYDILGYRIPKNINVTFMHQFLSMKEEQFPRPKEYIPERWITEKSDPLHYSSAHPFAFSPFGFGARSCIGRRIAELEIETFLTKVIKNFHLEWFGPDVKIKAATLNQIIGPFNFIFKDV